MSKKKLVAAYFRAAALPPLTDRKVAELQAKGKVGKGGAKAGDKGGRGQRGVEVLHNGRALVVLRRLDQLRHGAPLRHLAPGRQGRVRAMQEAVPCQRRLPRQPVAGRESGTYSGALRRPAAQEGVLGRHGQNTGKEALALAAFALDMWRGGKGSLSEGRRWAARRDEGLQGPLTA